MADNDVGVVSLDSSEQRVEQGTFCFDGLEWRSFRFRSRFETCGELFDWTDNGVKRGRQAVGWGGIVDVACLLVSLPEPGRRTHIPPTFGS